MAKHVKRNIVFFLVAFIVRVRLHNENAKRNWRHQKSAIKLESKKKSYNTSTDKLLILSLINPLKQKTVTEFDLSDIFLDTANYRFDSNRRIEILFGGIFVNKKKNSDFRRKIVNFDKFNTDRNSNDLVKRLFDSNKNNSNSTSNETDSKHLDEYINSNLDSKILL